MNLPNFLYGIKGITPEELQFLTQLLNGMTDEQVQRFVMIYSGKRFSTDTILLFTLLGFVGISGVQRFATRQIGMGILYFFTAGLCFIGTIVDLINYRSIANDFNQTIAVECVQMVKMSYNGY
ncbi:MAG: TM2 domain-containing protein [Arcticibacter sp.]